MKRSRHAFGWTLGLFCTALQSCSQAAHAEDASAAETAAARTLAVDGLKLAQAGNCAEAVPKLERAEKLYHSAVVAARLGECYVGAGRLVEGSEILRKVLREPLPAEPAPALLKALERAQRALDSAKPRIAGLTIKLAPVDGLSLAIDGEPVAVALLDSEIPSDPGEHTIEASAPGFLKVTTRTSIGDAEKKTISLSLTRDPNAAAAPARGPVVAEPSTARATPPAPREPALQVRDNPPPPKAAPNRAPAYLALGAGAVGVGVGAVLGVMTLNRREELKGSCPDDVCPSGQQDAVDSAKTLGNVSTIAFGVGGAGLALGTILLFTAGSDSSERARAPRPRRSLAGISNLKAGLGPRQLAVSGEF